MRKAKGMADSTTPGGPQPLSDTAADMERLRHGDPPPRMIARNLVEIMLLELQTQYIETTKELERVRANANAIKGAMQFAERVLRESDNTAGQPQPKSLECLKTAHDEGPSNA